MRDKDGASSRSHAAPRGSRQACYQEFLAALRFTRHQQIIDVCHDDDDDFPAQYAPKRAWVGLTLLESPCGKFGAELFRPYQPGSGSSEVAPSGPKNSSCLMLHSYQLKRTFRLTRLLRMMLFRFRLLPDGLPARQ